MIDKVKEILEKDLPNEEKARLINKAYLNYGRCSNVNLVIGITNNKVYKCFKKTKNAENYIGNSEKYAIQKINVE